MGRGGRVIYKKSKRKPWSKEDDDDDDGDEEYVVEEDDDEDSASSYEADAASSDEESFEFSDEEEETEISRSSGKHKKSRASNVSVAKKGRPRSRKRESKDSDYEVDEEEEIKVSRSRGNHMKHRVSDDELEDVLVAKKGKPRSRKRESSVSDYEVEDDNEGIKISRSRGKHRNSRVLDDEMEGVSVAKKGRPRSRKRKTIVSDYEVDDEEEEIKISRSRHYHRNSRVSDDEMEDVSVAKKGPRSRKRETSISDYEVDDDEEEIKISGSRRKHRNSRVLDDETEDVLVAKKGRPRSWKQKAGDADYEVDEDEEDEDFLPDEDESEDYEVPVVSRKRGAKNMVKKAKSKGWKKRKVVESPTRKRQRKSASPSSDDDFVVKDRVSVVRGKKGRKKPGKGKGAKAAKSRTRKKSPIVDSESLDSDFVTSDHDFLLENQVTVNRRKSSEKVKNTTGYGKSKRSSLNSDSSDYVISDEDEDDDDDDDDDDDEFMARDQVLVNKHRKKNKMRQEARSKTKRKMSSTNVNASDSDYKISEEDEFIAMDQVSSNKQQKKDKMKQTGSKATKNKFSVDSDSSDSDYSISADDDFMVESEVLNKQQKNKKGKNKKKTEYTTRRKMSSVVSDSSDYDDDINFEEEVRGLKIGGDFKQQHGQLVVCKNKEERGKEKETSESGKQVCGICLSEEQKGVVQGLLNCCTHYFCFACIMEWSKVESRCPVCKRRFVSITKSGRSDPGFGMRKAVIKVEKRDQVYLPSEEELRDMLDPYENVVCIECHQGGDDYLMLLCDICDSSAHTYCVGLGREVPEGNWYCGGCKSAGDGQILPQPQDSTIDQGPGGNNLFVGITERVGFTNMRPTTSSPQLVSLPSQSSLRIDLNASPRDFSGEDHYTSSPVYGSGPSTLSGRRHIQQRIRILLSNSRPRQNFAGNNMHSSVTDAVTSEGTWSGTSLHASQCISEHQHSFRPSFLSNDTLAPCMLKEGSSCRSVEGAKEQVHSMVRHFLQRFTQDASLERTFFKEIARKSTHTILAACGIEHRRDMVSVDVELPSNCTHDAADGPADLAKGCCSSCFNSFVKGVVSRLLNSYS